MPVSWRLSLVIALVVLSGLAGFAFAVWPDDTNSAGDELSIGGVPVTDDASVNAALAAAESRAGFPAKVPAFLPTSANKLVWVDSSRGPDGRGPGLIQLVYQGNTKVAIDGVETPSVVEIFLTDSPLRKPNGERVALDAGPFALYKDVVSRDEAGNPVKVTYTAVGPEGTVITDFSGEQPNDSAVIRMLESLETVK